jgi:hypothetical protein
MSYDPACKALHLFAISVEGQLRHTRARITHDFNPTGFTPEQQSGCGWNVRILLGGRCDRSRKPRLVHVRRVMENVKAYESARRTAMRQWLELHLESLGAQATPSLDFSSDELPLELQRQFERGAPHYERGHKRVLTARRELARAALGYVLRAAVQCRAIALYWQERTQRALCAPGGAGRAADAAAFESVFA